jgi:hypothetical protein
MSLTHETWLAMAPLKDEWFDDYYPRILQKASIPNFPEEVFEQWIHPHHCENNTLLNYSWIDWSNIEFELQEWEFHDLSKINVIDDFQDYVNLRGRYTNLDQFCCKPKDKSYWSEHGTWRIPPVILKVDDFKDDAPEQSELKSPFQLIEGHSRLGYLISMNRIDEQGRAVLAAHHKVFLCKKL